MSDAQSRIKEMVEKNKVLLFMKGNKSIPQCGFSSRVVAVLKSEGIPFETVNVLSDPEIRDGIKELAKLGAPPESLWPYDIQAFATKPPAQAFTVALSHQALNYQRVTQSLAQLKGALAAGFPFVFGFTVYESFESEAVAKSGVVPLPSPTERSLGGHAVMAVGYDDSTQVFRVENSWGPTWGQKGFFTIPYAYLASADLASDFWTIRLVEE